MHTDKRLLGDFQVLCLFSSLFPGVGKGWATHTDREQMEGWGCWLCTLHCGHYVPQGIRLLVQSSPEGCGTHLYPQGPVQGL